MPHWTYVLKDEKTERLYVGSTEDLDRRLAEHRLRKPSYILIYKEMRSSKADAFKREMYLKSGNGRRALDSLLKK
jgi:predicted GIY-YIG superfamily endonuclease